MSRFTYDRLLEFPREDVFAVIADVERYPEFLPGCRAARILEREGDDLLVEQELGIGSWRWRFRTRAHLDAPHSIRIRSREAPFAHLDQCWRFEQRPDGHCRVSLEVDYELRSVALRAFATRLFDEAFRRTALAFEQRLRQRHR